jgi:muconolactone delta-isomerase
MFQTAFHLPSAPTDLRKFSTGDYINPANNTETMADFARNTQAQTRFAKVYQRVQQWNSDATSATLATETADVDLDGQNEYLLFNSRVFAVFEGKGGRMTAAWIRHHSTKQVWQVAGNFAAYSNTDTEDEGARNLVVGTSTTLSAYRTSGFKDWWTEPETTGSSASVNATYVVTTPPSGVKGWKFTQGGISKTITLPNAWSGNLSAEYTLSGLSKLYVRFGLSPNLLDLMINGQNNLVPEQSVASATGSRLNLLNNGGTLLTSSDDIRAFLIAPQINGGASDKDQAGFTTFTRRNQAQTHQVEAELIGSGPHLITLGFDQGTDFTEPMDFDSDLDGIPDSWERTYNSGDIDSMTQYTDGDSDGLLDIQEYVMGSNPNDASSGMPAVEVSGTTASGFTITFPTVAGRTYQVLGAESLTSSSWPDIGPSIQGDGATHTVPDSSSINSSSKFYKVKITAP